MTEITVLPLQFTQRRSRLSREMSWLKSNPGHLLDLAHLVAVPSIHSQAHPRDFLTMNHSNLMETYPFATRLQENILPSTTSAYLQSQMRLRLRSSEIPMPPQCLQPRPLQREKERLMLDPGSWEERWGKEPPEECVLRSTR